MSQASNYLAELEARQAIGDALCNYCRAMDRIDDALGLTVFHADAVLDYGAMYRGDAAGFIAQVHQAHAGMAATHHQIGNVLIRVAGGRAWSESYVSAALRTRLPDGSQMEIVTRGRYLDEWERRGGRWAISQRHYLHAMDETRPVARQMFPATGSRDRNDLGYTLVGPIEPERSA